MDCAFLRMDRAGGGRRVTPMAHALPMRERAPEVALDEHYPRIARYVRGMVRDAVEAEDLTQETFLRAHRRRESLHDPDAALAWLYSIATHVCLDRMRQQARQTSAQSDVDPEAVVASDPEPSAELRIEQEQMSTCVRAHIAELSDSYRAVLLLHDEEGLTAREMAELLGASVGSVKIRLHRARKRLRRALEEGCLFSQDERGTLVCDPSPEGVPLSPGRSSHQ